jgi:hypothetical protein
MDKNKLQQLTLRELLEYERAAHIICAKYENLNKIENFASQELYIKFNDAKLKYDAIIDEIEKMVSAI